MHSHQILFSFLLTGSHPNSTEGIVEREFCIRGIYPNECCKNSILARVKNCGTFFVYELASTECDSAYCFGNIFYILLFD